MTTNDNPFLGLDDSTPGGSPSLVTGEPISPQGQGDNPFLGLDDGVPAPNLKPASILARQHAPDAYAKAEQLGQQVGLPADVLARNPNEAKRIEMDSMLADVQQRNPQLAAWLADGANLTVAQDDIPQLTGLARAVQVVNDYGGAPVRGFYGALGSGVSGLGDLLDSATYGASRLFESADDAEAYMRESRQSAINPSNWLRGLGAFLEHGGVQGLAAMAGARISGHPELDLFNPVPAQRSNLAIQSLEGLGNFGGQALATVVNPAGGIAILLGQGADQQADMVREAGQEGTGEAYAAIAASAPIAAALEKLPINFILKAAPPGVKNAVARYVLDKLAAAGIEATTEGAEQVAYNALARLYNPDQSLTDQVGGNFTVGGIVGGLARILLGHRFARTRSEIESENLDAMEQAASQSVLRTRDPARFSALVKHLVGQGNDTVYLNAEAAQTYFQSASVDPASVGIDPVELGDAVALGGDVAVPMETWLTRIAPDHGQGLREYRRMGQSSLSPDEVGSDQETDEAAERFLSSLQDAQAEPDTRVFNDVVGQLLGNMSQAEAEKSALPVQGLFNYLAKATGQDGFALYQKYGLQILQARPDLASMLPRSNVDARLDSMLDRIVAGEIPTARDAFGPSLVDFLVERGGIRDEAMTGELKRLAESDRATRAGRPRLVREDAKLDLDYAREAAVEAGYLPEDASVNDLLDALDSEVGQDKPVFSVANENRQAADIRAALTELSDELNRLGMDPTQDREAIKRALLGDDQTGENFFQSSDATGAAGEAQIETAAFKRWFGDSKVVDAEGKPLVVYHGTATPRFEKFAKNPKGGIGGPLGIWFASNPAAVESFTRQRYADEGGAIYPVHLAIRNPMEFHNWQDFVAYINKMRKGGSIEHGMKSARRSAISRGFDGVVIRNSDTDGGVVRDDWVAFEPTQIKSAVGNRGTFDPNNPSILHQNDDTTRGFIRFGDNRQATIGLTPNANLSTFLHETGHFMLEVMGDMAESTGTEASPPAEGMTRLYHGSATPGRYDGDAWFSTNREYAANYRDGAELQYVDVPTKWVNEQLDPDNYGQTVEKGFTLNVELGTDFTGPRRPLLQKSQIAEDYASILNWFGVAARADITTEHHEQFARGFEQYLGEGKAPTPELAGAFARFRAWMKAIYKTLTALNVELSDEVRGVFDRIVAGDPELVRARETVDAGPLFKEAARSGMSEARFREYLRLHAEANDEDEARITAEAMREVEREHKAWWRQEWDGIAAQVTAELHALPVYQAWAALTKNQHPDGTPLETAPIKLDKAALLERYGQEFLNKNLRWKNVYAVEGGINPDMAANLFGFRSADELVTALANAAPLKKAIKVETDARMRDLHGDMRMDGSLANKAMQAVHNDKRFKALAADIALLEKLANEPAMPAAAVRQWATAKVAGTTIRQLTPYAYLRSERKHAREAARLTAAGKWHEALLAQRRRLAFAHLYDVAVKAQERVEKRTKWLVRQNRTPTQKRLAAAGGEFRDQFNAVLAAIGLRDPDQASERGTLRAFVEAQQEALEETSIAESVVTLVDSGRPVVLREMTVGQFGEVYAAARNIAHLAGSRNKLLAAADKVKFDDAVTAMTDRAIAIHPERLPEELSRRDLSVVERAQDRLRKLATELDRPENIIEALDGGESGPWHDFFWNALNRAEDSAIGLRRRVGLQLKALRQSMPSDFMSSLDEKVDVPGIGRVSRGTLLGMVLNTGNAGNFQRLRDGGVHVNGAPVRMTDAQVAGLRELLTDDELRYTQGLWNAVNSLWPDIVALQKAMSGIAPAKVAAASFTVRGQTYQGGYWPLAYDHSKSHVGEKQSDDDAARVMAGMGFSRATTPQGYQKARVEEVSAPLQLDFGAVMARHLDNVMTDIAYRAAVKDTMRLLRSTRIKDAIISRIGKGAYDTLKGSVAYAVSSNELSVQAATSARRLMGSVVSNSAVSALAIRPDIALGNYGSALVQALDRVGVRSLMRGWWAIHTPGQAELTDRIKELSPFMAQRLTDIDYHYQQEITQAQGKGGYGAAYKRIMMTLHRWADHDVSRAAWWGRYQEALTAGQSAEEAVRLADKLVRQTQTATARKDVATIERDPAFRESRIFMGPMFVILGRLRAASKGEGATRTVGLRAASLLRQVFIAPALFVLLAGRWPQDDDDDGEIGPGEWATWLATNTLLFPLQTIPIVREASAAVEAWATGRPISPRAAPTAQAVAGMVKASKSIADNIGDYQDTGELDWWQMTRDLVSAVGPLFGAPSAQVQKTTKAIEYLEDNPDTGAVEMARLAVYGPPKK